MPTLVASAILTTSLLLASAFAWAAPGDLDRGFGRDGAAQYDLPGQLESVDGIAVQPDGKLVVSGAVDYLSPTSSFVVIRYLPDGGLDPTFGTGGYARIDLPGIGDFAYKVVLQPDGKIVAGGWANLTFALVRWDQFGALDPSFGSGGAVMVDFGNPGTAVRGMALQPDGAIVVAGSSDLARFLPAGALDPTFGTGGHVALPIQAYGLALQPDDAIVVAGAAGPKLGLVRYDTNGVLDPTFGVGGVVIASVTGGSNRAQSVARQSDGTLVVGGNDDTAEVGFVARYLGDGTLDSTFGAGGLALIAAPDVSVWISAAIVTDAGIVSIGQSPEYGPLFMTRHTFGGDVDSSFGARGVVHGFPAINEKGEFELTVQPDGKLVTAFSVAVGDGHRVEAVVARFEGGSIAGCSMTPLVGCAASAVPGASTLSIKRSDAAKSNALQWKWQKGPVLDVGDPIATDDYAFCLYDESGPIPTLLFQARAPAGGICRKPACWHPTAHGITYGDGDRTPEGLAQLTIAGTGAGQGKIGLKGRGENLVPPATPLALPLRAQLQGDNGSCWEATYGATSAQRNSDGRFTARSAP